MSERQDMAKRFNNRVHLLNERQRALLEKSNRLSSHKFCHKKELSELQQTLKTIQLPSVDSNTRSAKAKLQIRAYLERSR